MELNNDFKVAQEIPMTKGMEQYQLALLELNALEGDFQKEYHRLLNLLKQGNIETVLQIINHHKAVNLLRSQELSEGF